MEARPQVTELLEAFAAGYAESGNFPVPEWVRVAAGVACGLAGADSSLVETAGRAEGRRVTLIRRRQQIYDQHRAVLMPLAGQLAAAVHVDDMTRGLANVVQSSTEAMTGRQRSDAVKAAGLAILLRTLRSTDGLSAAWQQANADAYTEATAEGHAEASSSPATGGPPDPRLVAAAFEAAALGLAGNLAWKTANTWTERQLSGLAGDLARATGTITDASLLASPIMAALKDALGVAYYLEDSMHGAYAAGFAVYAQQASQTVNFTTVGDGKVESLCASYEAANPWPPDDVPSPPVHGDCRCWLETEDSAVPVNGVLTTV